MISMFLSEIDLTKLQALNQYFYKVCICRIQLRFKIEKKFYFTNYWRGALEPYVIAYAHGKGIKKLASPEANPEHFMWFSCQVEKYELFQLKNNSSECRLARIMAEYNGFVAE